MVFPKNHEKSGFLLMETLVAVLLFTVSLTILVAAYGHVQNNKRDAHLRLRALALARRIIDNNLKVAENEKNDFQTRIEWQELQTSVYDAPEASIGTVFITWHNGKKEDQISLTTITVTHG